MDVLVGLETNFGTTGQYILKAMQDANEVPLVDLFVRESLQNSLDAGNKSDKPIKVEYLIGNFDRAKLNDELEGSKDKLNKIFTENTYRYIAIKDSNTTGLDGKLLSESYENDVKGNFQKLVYGIGEPQENEGSGGSWGLGKTIYFRLGIGLVLYYSQYKDVDGVYKSRLAATLVESTDNIKFLPDVERKAGIRRTGAVWWGVKDTEGTFILPITDNKKINEILSIFELSPFGAQETGTVIIIPYINEKYILEKNQFVYGIEENSESEKYEVPSWNKTLENSMSKAACRWFFPRLKKPYSKWTDNQYFRLQVNNTSVEADDIFKILQEFYLIGIGEDLKADSFCKRHNIMPEKKDLSLDGYFKDTKDKLGTLVYKKIDNTNKDYFPIKPYYYLNYNNSSESRNVPIIPFVRKPGMIIDYNLQAPWTSQEYGLNENEYIIGVFILNSQAILKESGISLEEYIRKGEKSQHTRWIDQDINGKRNRVVHNINEKIKKELTSDFKVEKRELPSYTASAYSRKFSSFLPPRGYGSGSGLGPITKTPGTGGGGGGTRKTKPKKISGLNINFDKIEYLPDSVKIPCSLVDISNTGKKTIELHVQPLNKDESYLMKWADQKLPLPFEIRAVVFSPKTPKIEFIKTPGKKVVAFSFDSVSFESKEIDFNIEIAVYNKEYTPALVLK